MEPQGLLLSAHQPTLRPYAQRDPFRNVHPTALWSILILFPHLSPWSSKWPPFFRVPQQNPVSTSPLLHTCHMPPVCLILLNFITRIIFGEEYSLWNPQMLSPPVTCYLVHLRPKYLLQHPILKHPRPIFLPNVTHQTSHPHNNRPNELYIYIGM
jgi:hypothetical protein